MAKLLTVLLVALCFEAVGVVCLSHGLKQVERPPSYMPLEVVRMIGRGLANKYIIAGVFFEALFFAGLLWLMARADVSFVWPLTSLSFVFTTMAAHFWLQEHVSRVRWSGVILIVCGAGLITYSERFKKQPPGPIPPPPSAEDPGLQNLP